MAEVNECCSSREHSSWGMGADLLGWPVAARLWTGKGPGIEPTWIEHEQSGGLAGAATLDEDCGSSTNCCCDYRGGGCGGGGGGGSCRAGRRSCSGADFAARPPRRARLGKANVQPDRETKPLNDQAAHASRNPLLRGPWREIGSESGGLDERPSLSFLLSGSG